MGTYVVYERATGKIVHTHVQPDDLPMSREALRSLSAEQDPANLEILLIDPREIDVEGLYSVDPKSKVLRRADGKTATGFGIGAVRRASSDWPIDPVKVEYLSDEAASEDVGQ